jgi:aromatic-L-amino-acid/L-tryptophan decarboxylase
VNADDDLELVAPPSLSVVCFRAVPAGVTGDERLNEFNKHVLEQLQLSGRAFLSSTVLNGRFVLRACFVNPLSAQRDIDAMLETLKTIAREAIHRLAVS